MRSGVFISIAILLTGTALMFIKGTADSYSLSLLANFDSPSTLNSSLLPFSGLPAGLLSLDGAYYITLGLWVLLLTPVTVVAILVGFFLKEKNPLYVFLSIFVLTDVAIAILIVPGIVA